MTGSRSPKLSCSPKGYVHLSVRIGKKAEREGPRYGCFFYTDLAEENSQVARLTLAGKTIALSQGVTTSTLTRYCKICLWKSLALAELQASIFVEAYDAGKVIRTRWKARAAKSIAQLSLARR
jgi:hypothetical protein